MTEYNPEKSLFEIMKNKKKGNVIKMKNSSIRDQLMMKNKRASAYKEKIENYSNIFNEIKRNNILIWFIIFLWLSEYDFYIDHDY